MTEKCASGPSYWAPALQISLPLHFILVLVFEQETLCIAIYRFARPFLKLNQQDINGCFCHQEIPFSVGYLGLLIYLELYLLAYYTEGLY